MVWKKNIEYLKQHYRCIAIDLPGNGLSDQNEHKFTMQFFASCVAHFIAEMNLKNVCLVGHSMGGQIAMTASLSYPECAEKLVLVAPAGFEAFSALDKAMYYSTVHLLDLFSSEEHSLRHTIENSFFHHHKQGEQVIRELTEIMKTYRLHYYRKMVESCVKQMLEEPVLDRLHLLQQPTMVIFGKHDALIPNKLLHHTTTENIAKEGASRIPNARLALIEDCGHFVQWERPDEVNHYISGFMG
jgi:pimeloyl-ACP methyl ester carboxylesterase